MQSGLRPAARSLRSLRPQRLRPARRHASDSHGHGHGHGHGHHAAPANESFGTGFYLSIGAIPASFLLYKLTGAASKENGEEPWFSRVIARRYNEYREQFARRNETHTRAIEQAAADRLLFMNESNRNPHHIELRFPEQLNGGSPWNVPAGHGHANLDHLIAKYQRDADELQAKKLQQLRENRVPAEQPVTSLTDIRPRADS